ncbi:uncharacterized protein LACBIDRAFT_326632 [Laccaria bicolor S238N-H82]|uniref:Predicted protein n=1 Tax=Laccaria bicolor (strain S238N-H82 / ATCC MYA-4686) TaxID=486041 RepID=B0D9A3_LACBS|nr:uncharacterized protein LACBIDRAFT_326632 [Laccaria bicolor S238N-H82]EDR08981.1 predicted protein [Laccaria bicolor S238N-H82]|eukprot:XP_001880294.1 predicted protein [Laccaria bicolor S238N-H82]
MATRTGDLKSFKPILPADLAELTKRTYKARFQEEQLSETSTWRFMDGPSTQVTVHHRGTVASSPFFDDPLFHDQISAQEENLVHGFVSAENPEHHRWLFPTTDVMEDFCHHWSGEWTAGCDSIFHNIAKALECGTAKPLTRKGWKSYLHSTNHRARRPTVHITATHFSEVDELLLAFPDPWHGKHIADINFPTPFDSLITLCNVTFFLFFKPPLRVLRVRNSVVSHSYGSIRCLATKQQPYPSSHVYYLLKDFLRRSKDRATDLRSIDDLR